ncbi:immunity 49 family protein [Streptomyces flavofungini]|uniref:immunity 49 family protein n=1 Tax=Streptomyces flavofungini TaxID=68200 RepID=UPI0025AFFEC8|nr:immunity 49 family protein [Streptomyces flavofungini]WJV50954.1 immunity 49 family protein [Streptomyces flavofungini]
MRDVTCHEVGEDHLSRALDDITGRTWERWRWMRYDDPSPRKMRGTGDELLDHVAARTVAGGALDETAATALRTAAECFLGELSVGCFPGGDQEVLLPLIEERLSSDDIGFADVVAYGSGTGEGPSARTWLDAFAVCVVSGLVWDWQRVTGLLLRSDYAPAIRDGVPYSTLPSRSDPADLAAMDALCCYLSEAKGHLPRDWPTVPLCKPDADERAEAARQLDGAGALPPDHRLLRVLIDDDQDAFEQALEARLVEHRDSVGADPAPRTLLPLGPLVLAALAVQTHGWELRVRSGYLPGDLVGSPGALRQAADSAANGLGKWAAK